MQTGTFSSGEALLENRRVSAQNITNFFAGDHDSVSRFVHHAS
jgi:hypothetical protein